MIKVGIVGARGLSTMMGFRDLEGVEVTAICDLDEALLKEKQEKFNVKNTYRIYEDMLESDIDAVVIATPMQCHVPQAIAALQAGKHVMSEVVAGVTMDELWWLVEEVEKSGKIYMFAENYCYMPQNQLVRELKRQGFFGDVYYAEGEYLHNLDDFLTYSNGKPSWRQYWQCGKHGTFYPTHSLGPVMQWFEGERIAQIATFGTGHHHSTGLRQEDTTVTMCQTESGKLIRIRVDAFSPRPHNMRYYQLQGTKGCYEAPRGLGDVGKIALVEEGNPKSYLEWRPLDDFHEYMPERYRNATRNQLLGGHGGGDYFIVKDFVDAIRNNTKPDIDVYQACEWTAVGLLSEISIQNGSRMIDVPNFRRNMPRDEQLLKLWK